MFPELPIVVEVGSTYPEPPNTELRALEWGMPIPRAATVAWGARAIYHLDPVEVRVGKNGKRLKHPRAETRATIDLLWDRKSATGDQKDVDALCAWLDKYGLKTLKQLCEKQYITSDSNEIITIEANGYKLVASPRESYGYLYISAWKVG